MKFLTGTSKVWIWSPASDGDEQVAAIIYERTTSSIAISQTLLTTVNIAQSLFTHVFSDFSLHDVHEVNF